MASPTAARILKNVEEAWHPFMVAVDRLREADIERPLPGSWSVREMLAHVAFWDEAVIGVLVLTFRGSTLPEGWTFGSGYNPDPGIWPAADVHNAREAEWARRQSAAAVVARLAEAHEHMLAAILTVTGAEAEQHGPYFGQLGKHYLEHLPELASVR